MKQNYFLIGLFLLIFNQGYSQYIFQVSSIDPLSGGQSYALNQSSNPLNLSLNVCAFGNRQPQNATQYTLTWYVNSINSTEGGTLLTSRRETTVAQYGLADIKTYQPSTNKIGTYYYYAVLSNPSATSCGFTGTLVSTIQRVDVVAPATFLNFDGIDDKVIVPNESNFDFTTSFSMEAWIQVSSFTQEWQTVISKGAEGPRIHRYGISDLIAFGTGSEDDLPSMVSVNDGNWHHIAATFDNGVKTLYVDGVLQGTQVVVSPLVTNDDAVRIGSQIDYYNPIRAFQGNIDEVRIWNIARTADQISGSKNCELQGDETGLVAYYKFNQGLDGADNSAITTLTDATANANNGALINFASTGTDSNWLAGSPAGGIPAVISIQPKDKELPENDSLVLTVTAAGASSYQWEFSTDATTWNPLDDSYTSPDVSGSTTNTLTISGSDMINLNDLSFRVVVNGTSMCSTTSDAVKIKVTTSALGTKSYKIDNLKIYPNPSTGVFNVDSQEELEYTVFDLGGKKILTKKSTKGIENLDLTNYQSGIYMLNVINLKGEKNTYKLIKK